MKKITVNGKIYKLIIDKDKKEILYPEKMSKSFIDFFEKCRNNNKFVNITLGNIETGQSWEEVNDVKGKIGLSKGTDYYFPLLVSFKEDFDKLNEMSLDKIYEFINLNGYDFDNILDNGGSLLSDSVIGIKVSNNDFIVNNKFHSIHDFNKHEIVKKNLIKNVIIKDKDTNQIISKDNIEFNKFDLNIYNNKTKKMEKYAGFDNEHDAENFIEMLKDNHFVDILKTSTKNTPDLT